MVDKYEADLSAGPSKHRQARSGFKNRKSLSQASADNAARIMKGEFGNGFPFLLFYLAEPWYRACTQGLTGFQSVSAHAPVLILLGQTMAWRGQRLALGSSRGHIPFWQNRRR